MFTKDKVISASTKITTSKSLGNSVVASLQGPAGGTNVNVSTYTNSQYSYYLTGLLPASPDIPDSSSLALFYRDIYLLDNVGGSAVDIQSEFPFSDWELRGLEEKDLGVFNDALERLNLRELLPQISKSYLTDGFYAGSLVFDPAAKNFMDILTHDALQCSLTPSAFNNVDPEVRVTTSGPTLQMLNNPTAYQRAYLSLMSDKFKMLLKEGSFILDPLTSLIIARRTLTDRTHTSYLHRLLPMYLIEKTMYRGTLIEANRRQRAMTHIQAGDDLWTPTSDELSAIIQQFQMAESDPLGGWISTRNAVQVQDLRTAGDFWKWSDMSDQLVNYKLRALGISEAFLSGDACLVGSTLVTQADGTKCRIEDLCPVDCVPHQLPIGEWFDLYTDIPNRVTDSARTKAWSYQGYRETFTVTTESGESITATDNHPFWVMGANGECSWKRLDELQEGDLVAIE